MTLAGFDFWIVFVFILFIIGRISKESKKQAKREPNIPRRDSELVNKEMEECISGEDTVRKEFEDVQRKYRKNRSETSPQAKKVESAQPEPEIKPAEKAVKNNEMKIDPENLIIYSELLKPKFKEY